jgi:ATP-dependent RNA helicase HelY
MMEEVHHPADRCRGAGWEEVISHLPDSVAVVALSATVSNAEEFGEWLRTVRGDTHVVVEEHRPVPLWQHVMAGDRLYDLFVDEEHRKVNPDLLRLARDDDRMAKASREFRRDRDVRAIGQRPRRGGSRQRSVGIPRRHEVVERLQRERLLPAIYFVFSRVGCAAAVEQCLEAGLRLTTTEEREQIRSVVERRTAELPDEDLLVLGYADWLDGLTRGFAAHHAGLLPTFKETVEELFQRGLVKCVFATETLALGINMPARSVALEKLVKWNGEAHAAVTPGEYTQLTGRAGRRGIDIDGSAIVVWHRGFDPIALAGLASTRTYPLRSSFRPSYNMAVNLVGSVGWHASRELLETSFAQFQADRAVVGMARDVRKQQEALAGYRDAMTCHLGDFEEYARLRRSLTERERALSREGTARRRADAVAALEQLRPGDVVVVPAGRRSGPAVVLDPGLSEHDEPRTVVLGLDKQVRRLSVADFRDPVTPLLRVRIPRGFSARSANSRRDLATLLRDRTADLTWERPKRKPSGATDDARVLDLRARIRAHPCHGCAEREDHARWAERYRRLREETTGLERRVDNRTSSIARQYDHVCTILAQLGYLTAATGDAAVTGPGRMLQRLYTELDLLAAECLRAGVWERLTAPELAACASLLVYEARSGDGDTAPARTPRGPVRDAIAATMKLYDGLSELERDHRVSFLRLPDAGFAWPAYRWASGQRLEAVLRDAELTAGDFVRWCKQLGDLLGQVATAAASQDTPAGNRLARTAREAVDAILRGVVSLGTV